MILVVDDHADGREVLVRLLKGMGYEAIGVDGGEAAIAYLGTQRPSLVILDCDMPCLDGIGVLRQMRASASMSDIPVVMFSGDNNGTHEVEALRLGAHAFIQKGSLDFAPLWEQVKRHAGSGRGKRL